MCVIRFVNEIIEDCQKKCFISSVGVRTKTACTLCDERNSLYYKWILILCYIAENIQDSRQRQMTIDTIHGNRH